MKKTISISSARQQFAKIINDTANNNHEYEIVRRGKTVAKIIGPDTKTTKVSSGLEKDLDEIINTYREDLNELAKK